MENFEQVSCELWGPDLARRDYPTRATATVAVAVTRHV